MASETPKQRVLFVCGHNAGRSICAEAICRHLRPDIEVCRPRRDRTDRERETRVQVTSVLADTAGGQLWHLSERHHQPQHGGGTERGWYSNRRSLV
eukprot:scaffold8181_cov350-Prasinococcus_capsulatus_cf.AAC.1